MARRSWLEGLVTRLRWWLMCNHPVRHLPSLPAKDEPVRPRLRAVGKLEPRRRTP